MDNDSGIELIKKLAGKMKNGEFHFDLPELKTDDEFGELAGTLLDIAQNLKKRFNELETLAKVTAKINAGFILDEILDHVYESFHSIIPYDRIGFALIDEDEVYSYYGKSNSENIKIQKGYHASLNASSLSDIIKTGKPRIINDLDVYLSEHPNSSSTKLILEEGMHSNLTCPLIVMGKPIGFIFFTCKHRDAYQNVHIELFLQIAGQLAMIVEKSRLYQELQNVNQKLNRHNQFIQHTFGRYLSDDVVENLLSSPASLSMGGEKKNISILMTDLRGFTAMSEALLPEQVLQLLNHYFEAMTEVVIEYNGTINEFIGDAILVLFGAPTSMDDHAEKASACAVAMQLAMEKVNEYNQKENLPQIEMGIAINSGEMVVGNIGSEKRAKYGVVGSHVNLTARIESFTQGGQILISENTFKQLKVKVTVDREMHIRARGFHHPVTVYDLKGIFGTYRLSLPARELNIRYLEKSVDIKISLLHEDHEKPPSPARVTGVCERGVVVESNLLSVKKRAERLLIKLDESSSFFPASDGKKDEQQYEFYGKSEEILNDSGTKFVLRYSYLPPLIDEWLKNLTPTLSEKES